jgi:hypothetical protein
VIEDEGLTKEKSFPLSITEGEDDPDAMKEA